MRIGIGLGDIAGRPATIDDLVAQAAAAERDGFRSGWLANIFGVDAIMGATLCARGTRTLEVGTAVTPTFPRHPQAMAQQALTAAAASGGRFVLGIGLSHKLVVEDMLGMSWAKPYSHMREYLAVLGPLLRQGAVQFQGDEYRVSVAAQVPGAMPPPILVAALAPKMLALAGRETDGTITWMTGGKTIGEHVAPRIREAAAAAGRPEPRIVVGLPIAVTTEVRSARESAAKQFEIYGSLPSYRAMLDREGAGGPSDVTIVGDEAAVGEALGRLAEAGATDFLAVPFAVAGDSDALARTRDVLAARARAS